MVHAGRINVQMPRKNSYDLLDVLKTALLIASECRDGVLPGIHVLAGICNVSIQTMWKAVSNLKKQDLLKTDRALKGIEASVHKVGNELRDQMEQGRYRSGTALPKITILAEEYHVSRATVISALRLLEKEKLTSRQGKRWVAGSPRTDVAHNSGNKGRTVLVLAPFYRRFNWCTTGNNIVRSFYEAFTNELLDRNIQPKLAFYNEKTDPSILINGYNQIVKLVGSLGDRLLGMLLMGEDESNPLPSWYDRLISRNLPIVWFDSFGKYSLDRKTAKMRFPDNFYVITRSERIAVSQMIDALKSRGHTRIGIPVLKGIYSLSYNKTWIDTRMALLNDSVRDSSADIQLFPVQWDEQFWYPDSVSTNEATIGTIHYLIETLVKRHGADRSEGIISAQELLRRNTPAISDLLFTDKVTAMIGLSDFHTACLSVWLKLAGIEVPGQCALISFDNYPVSQLLNFTSIDFNYRLLGYRATHKIINDIPVPLQSGRYIIAPPVLNVRESL
jgi:DNA-binding transcriptional regulator YhcF (GntR family)